jgi:ankyrin repeat protein
MASQEGHYKVVETLISKGADVNFASGVDETTPIIVASQNGHLRVVELLVDTGADCNARTTDDGLTALLAASNQGHTAIVARLIKDGADVDAALFIDDGSYQKTGPTSLMQAGPVNLHSIHALFAFLPFVSHCFIFCNERLYALCFILTLYLCYISSPEELFMLVSLPSNPTPAALYSCKGYILSCLLMSSWHQ